MSCPLDRDDIDSYLDRELDPERLSEVEAHLAVCPACSARVAGEVRVRERMAALGADEVAPADLRQRVTAQVRAAVTSGRAGRGSSAVGRPAVLRLGPRMRTVLAGLAAAAIAAFLLWTLVPRVGVDVALAAGLAEDHVGHHGPDTRQVAFESEDPVAVERWLAERLGMEFRLPPPPPGARLIGGQVCVVDGRQLAHAVYEIAGRAVSYFVVPHESGPARPTPGEIDGLNYVTWRSAPGQVVVLSSAPESELMPFHLE